MSAFSNFLWLQAPAVADPETPADSKPLAHKNTSSKVSNCDWDSIINLHRCRKFYLKSTILRTTWKSFSGVRRSNNIVDTLSSVYKFALLQVAATSKSGMSSSKSGGSKVDKITELLKLWITATTTIVSNTVSPSTELRYVVLSSKTVQDFLSFRWLILQARQIQQKSWQSPVESAAAQRWGIFDLRLSWFLILNSKAEASTVNFCPDV